MSNYNQKNKLRSSFYRLTAATLTVGGVSSLLLPYLAIAQTIPPTRAGEPILNRATGTYDDPNTGERFNVTSNEVRVTVAEIAGITNVPAGIIDTNGGSISTNDVLNFDFLVTNTGNAPSRISFPAIADIVANNATNGLDTGTLQYQLDLNNDGVFSTVPTDNEGLRTDAFTPTNEIAPGASVRVRIVGTVNATAAGAPVNVRYGDTGANDNSAGTQNQPDRGTEPPDNSGTEGTNANEVRTVNVGAETPVNGEREASAFQGGTVATAVRNIALSTVLKTRVAYDPVGAASVQDDLLTYRLDLRVASTSPNPSIYTPTALEGTTILLGTGTTGTGGTNQTRILISDVIPESTVIDETFNAALNLPAGWQAVYQYSADANIKNTTIPIVATGGLAAAQWSTTAPTTPAEAANVRRVGYIFNSDVPANSTLPTGFTTELVANAFRIRVRTATLPLTGGVINNIAQVFGETVGDPTNRVVYDESGDQNPNNFEGTVPPAVEGTSFNPTNDRGVPNPGVQDTDGANTNTGTGPGGEVNIFPIVPPGTILNGPNNVPGAIGRTNNQDDFTNRSAALPAANSVPGTTYDPAPIIFNNTFQNPPSNTTRLDTVRLLPLPPDNASVPAASRAGAVPGDIPDNTSVILTFGNQVAEYNYTAAGGYAFVTGTNLPTGSQSILLDNVQPGVLNNYTVSLNLPTTALSVDRFTTIGADRAGYSVPIVAFVDNDNNGAFLADNDPIFNITIDRGYTGYVRLRKQSQILKGSNPRPVTPAANGVLSVTDKTAEPGNVIRYVIDYVNFSLPLTAASTGSVILDAANLVITESGTTATNTWGAVSVHFSDPTLSDNIDFNGTTTTVTQTTSATLGNITYDGAAIPDPVTGTAVGIYVNNVGTIIPALNPATFQGRFIFHRRVN